MRVLFVNENIGGHATVHLNLEHALAEVDGLEASFTHVARPGLLRKLAAAPVPLLDRLDVDMQPLRSQLCTSAAARQALSQARGFDLVHLYTQNAGLLSASLLRSLPSVVSTDSTDALNAYRLPYRRPGRFTPLTVRLTQRFEKRVYSAATLVVANTRWVADSLLAYGVPEERIRLLPFGVEIPEPAPQIHATSPPTITFVGRQMERKGGYRLVDLYRERLSDRCVLTLVTTDPVRPQRGVTVLDDVRPGDGKLAQVLARTSAFVFPSEIDQAPNAVLEAMAHGVPVVAIDQGALPEMIQDGATGFLVAPGDDDGLVQAVGNLIDDPELSETMGAEARRVACQHYDIRASARRLVSVLTEARDLYERAGPCG